MVNIEMFSNTKCPRDDDKLVALKVDVDLCASMKRRRDIFLAPMKSVVYIVAVHFQEKSTKILNCYTDHLHSSKSLQHQSLSPFDVNSQPKLKAHLLHR